MAHLNDFPRVQTRRGALCRVLAAPLLAAPLLAAPFLAGLIAIAPAFAQKADPAAKPPAAATAAPKLDPAVREAAARMAAPLRLSSADGARGCAFALKPDAAGPGLAVEFDRPACADIGFSAQVVAWLPDPSGSIRLLNAQGRTVAEFTEGTEGSYEALREGDGVYFLANPAVAEGTELKPEEVVGDWDLARQVGTPVCRVTLLDSPAKGGGFRLSIASGCDAALLRFGPTAWDIEGGNILVRGEGGASVIRFARQEDGGWARTPERGRPLLMTRP
ncbi:protease inhibitor Inh/omp19 family protein [Xanthobacter aminoxidans]|uniref:protease inhibitor Inh/omp19 family protein n=1 Tax=Xanthobacter aminoxidans TaxID=186280 RepID=UPI002022D796|nr:protease inhibitor Inh/omp19 family protein [Xanthobacter aminoxidans]MCL8383744.1 protease inhibitor Inh/omp19 family protein [Xanthobacter aminoxidans]